MPPERAYIENLRLYHKYSEELHLAAVVANSIPFFHWLASLFVVAEGFKEEYRLTDPDIDKCIASPFYDKLRRFRNAVLHVQRDFFCEKTFQIIDARFLAWVKSLRLALFNYLYIKNPPRQTQTVAEFMEQVECFYGGAAEPFIAAIKQVLAETLGSEIRSDDQRMITPDVAEAVVQAAFARSSMAAGADSLDTMRDILSRMHPIEKRIARAKKKRGRQ